MHSKLIAFIVIALTSTLHSAMLEFSSFPEGKGFMFLTYRKVTEETLIDIINETCASMDHPITGLRLYVSDDLSALPNNMFNQLTPLEHLFIHGMKEHILPDSILNLTNLKEFIISPNRNIYDYYPSISLNQPFRLQGHKLVQAFIKNKVAKKEKGSTTQ